MGGYFVPLYKNESNSPSSPLAPSLFQAKLSAPLYLMALLVETEMGEEKKRSEKQTQKTPFTGQSFALEKALLVPLFKMNGSVFPPLFRKGASLLEGRGK